MRPPIKSKTYVRNTKLGSFEVSFGASPGLHFDAVTIRQRLGRPADAEWLFKRTLDNAQKVLGPDHAEVGKGLNNIAEL